MKINILILSFLPVSLFADDNTVSPYPECYDMGISAEIRECMNEKMHEEKKRYEEAWTVFVDNARESEISQLSLFERIAPVEKHKWENYLLEKCAMESTDFTEESYAYWTYYYQCMAMGYREKHFYYLHYRF
ncbi:hypothetical protein [[Erwinia] mediterraneensis]|uniref:hypothetical protein n=1 Tax=[Erwinia] mediterraneensis TaxID=2161819 RepID=UPI0010323FB5|nr:hypothetical protein [[Erwinia] mediterraneensis]